MKKEQNIYDLDEFYNEYIKMRETHLNANDLLEIPVMKEMLPDLKGKTVLDLGCGYGEMSRYFIDLGAERVVACDISQNMINLAKKINGHEKIEYLVLPMEQLSSLDEKFDIVFSSLAFHYIEDFDKLIKDISSHLNSKGILLFSQEHPLVTAPILNGLDKRIDLQGKRYFLLSDYNVDGIRKTIWNNTEKISNHRSFTTLINTIIKHDLQIAQIHESTARKEAVEKVAKYIYQNDRPYFLFIKAVKK